MTKENITLVFLLAFILGLSGCKKAQAFPLIPSMEEEVRPIPRDLGSPEEVDLHVSTADDRHDVQGGQETHRFSAGCSAWMFR